MLQQQTAHAVGSGSAQRPPAAQPCSPRCPLGGRWHMSQQQSSRDSRTLHHNEKQNAKRPPTCPVLFIQRAGGRHVAQAHGVEEELLEPPLRRRGGRLARRDAWASG